MLFITGIARQIVHIKRGYVMQDKKVGIIGVGLMGLGIASNIQKNGWQIGVLDHPGNQPIDTLTKNGAGVYQTGEELASHNDVILLCVTGSPQVEDVLTNELGVLKGLGDNKVVIDCSTAIPNSTLKMAQMVNDTGADFMDAPMTRTPKEAMEGRLNLIVGGDPGLFDAYKPLLEAFSENLTYAGPVGSGHMMKLLHNFVSLGFSGVLAEAAACCKTAGLDEKAFYDILAKGGGAGVILDRLSPFLLNRDASSFRFSINNSCKDIGYYMTMSDDLMASNEIAKALNSFYKSHVEAGHGDEFVPQIMDFLSKK